MVTKGTLALLDRFHVHILKTVSSRLLSVPFQAKLDHLVSSHSITDMGIVGSATLVNEHTAAS